MFFELQDKAARKATHKLHAQMIEAALVEIFDFDKASAKASVAVLLQRYDDAPVRERDYFVHEDPVNLAAEIAEKPDAAFDIEPFASRLKSYNENIRPAFMRRAREHYETKVKPNFDKLKAGS
jgi:hypothetical protein